MYYQPSTIMVPTGPRIGCALTETNKLFVFDLNFVSAKLYGELAEKLKSNAIAPLDLLIANIALTNKQTLIIRNIRHFERVPGLQVEGW